MIMKYAMKSTLKAASGLMIVWALLLPISVQSAPMVLLPDFSVLAEENSPVVVNISTTKKVSRAPQQFQGIPDEMLRYFFGLPGGRGGHGQMPRDEAPKEEVSSLGSGFIISEDGYIVTNNHVIDGADDIVVRMRNRQELKAKVVGADARTDIALLKVEASGLPTAKIGSSADLKVGQWVVAIGEPFGLDYTVTHGIVSALGRSLPDDTYVPFIQTDVSINPGNSGGPLFDMKGEVVGVNSQIYSKSGGSMGLSFSIPIDLAMHVVEQIKSNGKVSRGFLGVQVQEVTADLAKSFGMSKPMGALVAETVKGSAAEKAGIQSGDVILEFNGRKINKSSDLPPVVGTSPLDQKLPILILRNGEEKSLKVKLQSISDDEVADNGESVLESNALNAELGEVDAEVLKRANIPFGVRVVRLAEGAAQQAGMMPGDIIVTINFQPVKSVDELTKILKNAPKGRSIPVRVVRDKRSLFLPLVLK